MLLLSAKGGAIVGAASLCAMLCLGCGSPSQLIPGVTVRITNKTGKEIKNLKVEFTGGVATIATIKPGDVHTTVVNSTGESSLTLRFTDASGKEQSQLIGVYLEANYKGKIVIELGPDGKVAFEDKSRSPY